MTGQKFHLWSPGFQGFGGGITAFSRELAIVLRDRGGRVHLLGKHDRSGEWSGLRIRGAGGFPPALRTSAFTGCLLTSALLERPTDIVSTHLNFGPIAHLAHKVTGVNYALVVHGVDVHPELSRSRLAALRSANRIIAVSQWTRNRVLSLGGISDDRVCVLPNTYDDQRFRVTRRPPALVQRYGIATNEKVILTVARLDRAEGYKGYDRVLEAMPAVLNACGEVRFLIAGKGDDSKRLVAMAGSLGISDRVTFTGFVPDEELADHYRLADAFAMPSTGEGFGIVFLEAMGCGTPVLAGNADGSVDALDGGRLGQLVDPRSVDAIVLGLIALLRRQGPEIWFDRQTLSDEVRTNFGRKAFFAKVSKVFS